MFSILEDAPAQPRHREVKPAQAVLENQPCSCCPGPAPPAAPSPAPPAPLPRCRGGHGAPTSQGVSHSAPPSAGTALGITPSPSGPEAPSPCPRGPPGSLGAHLLSPAGALVGMARVLLGLWRMAKSPPWSGVGLVSQSRFLGSVLCPSANSWLESSCESSREPHAHVGNACLGLHRGPCK